MPCLSSTRFILGAAGTVATLTLGAALAHAESAAAPTPTPAPPATAQPVAPPPGYPAQPYPAYPAQPGYATQPGYPAQPVYPAQPGYPVQPGLQPQPGAAMPPGYPPPGYYVPQQRPIVGYRQAPRVGLIAAGAAVFGGLYILSASVTAIFDCNASGKTCSGTYWPMYVPLVGPWIQMAYVGNESYTPAARFGLAMVGLGEAAGLAMLIAGAVAKEKVPIYALGHGSHKATMQLAPLTLANGGGLLALGRF